MRRQLFAAPWGAILLFINAILLIASGASADQSCYTPSGTVLTTQLPCQGTQFSTCCNRGDVCLANGLCQDMDGDNLLYRGGCTIHPWDSSRCTSFCADNDTDISIPHVYPCPDQGNLFYCGYASPNNCAEHGDGVFNFEGELILQSGSRFLVGNLTRWS
jgi:hypothetical protein